MQQFDQAPVPANVPDRVTANETAITNVQDGLAYIVGNTNTTGSTLAVGQFVYVKGHSTIAEGLYKVTASISANGSITTSNTTAVSGGGLNELNSKLDGYVDASSYAYNSSQAMQAAYDAFNNAEQGLVRVRCASGEVLQCMVNHYSASWGSIIAHRNNVGDVIHSYLNNGTWVITELATNSNIANIDDKIKYTNAWIGALSTIESALATIGSGMPNLGSQNVSFTVTSGGGSMFVSSTYYGTLRRDSSGRYNLTAQAMNDSSSDIEGHYSNGSWVWTSQNQAIAKLGQPEAKLFTYSSLDDFKSGLTTIVSAMTNGEVRKIRFSFSVTSVAPFKGYAWTCEIARTTASYFAGIAYTYATDVNAVEIKYYNGTWSIEPLALNSNKTNHLYVDATSYAYDSKAGWDFVYGKISDGYDGILKINFSGGYNAVCTAYRQNSSWGSIIGHVNSNHIPFFYNVHGGTSTLDGLVLNNNIFISDTIGSRLALLDATGDSYTIPATGMYKLSFGGTGGQLKLNGNVLFDNNVAVQFAVPFKQGASLSWTKAGGTCSIYRVV